MSLIVLVVLGTVLMFYLQFESSSEDECEDNTRPYHTQVELVEPIEIPDNPTGSITGRSLDVQGCIPDVRILSDQVMNDEITKAARAMSTYPTAKAELYPSEQEALRIFLVVFKPFIAQYYPDFFSHKGLSLVLDLLDPKVPTPTGGPR